MSAALWHFFWVEGDWTGSPPAPTPSPPPPSPSPSPPPPPATELPGPSEGGGGGGGHKQKDKGRKRIYAEVPHDFWDVREAYLRSLFEKAKEPQVVAKRIAEEPIDAPPPAPAPKQLATFLPRYTEDLAEAVSAVRLAENAEQMRKAGQRVVELNRRYAAALKAQQAEEKAAAEARAVRQAERARKREAALKATKLLLRSIGRTY